MKMKNMFIIADDLTGAADTGVQFSPHFEDTILISYHRLNRIPEPTLPSVARVLAIYTNSRALTGDAANHRLISVARWLAGEKSTWIYKKIDSCVRGNVGSEADALLDELQFEASFITPAFPEMGRTTCDDIHLVHGIPLEQTETSRDPVTPVKESRLSLIVRSQSKYPVGHIGLGILEGRQSRLIEEIQSQMQDGVRHFVFDATGRIHLDRIANLMLKFEAKILPVGSAGLAGSVAQFLPLKPAADDAVRPIKNECRCLLVCGTASAVTRRQIEYLAAHYVYDLIQLDPMVLADQNRRYRYAEAMSSARSQLLKNHVILTIKSQPNQRNTSRQTISLSAADLIVKGLGRFVAGIVADTKPGYLFLSGGDTADAVLRSVQAEGVRIIGEAVAGVVQGVIGGGLLDGLPVATKAGAFGDRDTLVVLHEKWQKDVQG